MRLRLTLALLLVAGCGSQEAPRLTPVVKQIVSAGVPGALALVRVGDRTQAAAIGLADIGARANLRAEDRFRVGSVTKTFVATVVLQLAGEGRLRLDDSVHRWLPGLLPDGDRITIRELLAHRSGLPDVADDAGLARGRDEGAVLAGLTPTRVSAAKLSAAGGRAGQLDVQPSASRTASGSFTRRRLPQAAG